MADTIEVYHEAGGPILIPADELGKYEARGYRKVEPRKPAPKPKGKAAPKPKAEPSEE